MRLSYTGGFGATLRVPGVSIRDLSTAPIPENRPKSTSSLISSIQKVADLVAEFWGSLARRREGSPGSGACHWFLNGGGDQSFTNGLLPHHDGDDAPGWRARPVLHAQRP